MDAGLVRKLNDQCRFLPLRHELPPSQLPPLLSGIHSPAITSDDDIAQLVNDIYGVSRRPPRGGPPPSVAASKEASTGYSAGATAVAKLFVEQTKDAQLGDPQLTIAEIAAATGLSSEDTEDALHELRRFVKVSHDNVWTDGDLFPEFDRHWMPWSAADDALRLAADIMSDPDFPHDCQQIADRYGWEPRRLNPVIHYLLERQLIVDYQALGTAPWAIARIVGQERSMRRFVKSRS